MMHHHLDLLIYGIALGAYLAGILLGDCANH